MCEMRSFQISIKYTRFAIVCLVALCVLPASHGGESQSAGEAARKVQHLLQQGDLAAARSVLTDALTEFPREASLYNLQGVIEAQQGNYADAQASFRKAIEEAPHYTGAFLNLGRLYQENAFKDPVAAQKALETYQRLLRFEPDNVEANYQAAVLLLQRGSYQASLDRLAHLPTADQDHPQAMAMRCGDYAGLGQQARASSTANRLLQSPGLTEPDIHLILPVLAAHQQAGIAVRLLEGIETRNPASYESLHALGLLYQQQGRFASARATLEKAAQLKPDSAPLLMELARVAYDQKDYTGALGYLAHARDLSPQNAAIHFFWGIICVRQNLAEEAYRALKRAASLDPEHPSYNYAVGVVAMQRENASEAVPYLQKFCALRPKDPLGPLALGAAYLNSHDLEKARDMMVQAAGQPQTAADANYYLGRIAYEEGDYTTALRYLQAALKYNPNHADAYAEVGLILLKQRQYQEAKEALQKALQLNPDSYTANLNLTVLYQKMKDPRADAQAKHFDEIKDQRAERAKEFLRRIEVRP